MARRLDDLQNGYRIYQDPASFCFGIDAVLLAHYASLKPGDRVLDLGCGNGAVPLIMIARAPSDVTFCGVEIQPEAASLARDSVSYNGLEERVTIVEGDLRQMPPGGEDRFKEAFRVVTANPPYYKAGSGRLSKETRKAAARHELTAGLKDFVRAAAVSLCSNGRFYMIHIPERLPEIFRELSDAGLEPKTMRLVHPSEGQAPTMVLIGAVKGGKPGLKAEAPLIIYGPDGTYTDEVMAFYRPL